LPAYAHASKKQKGKKEDVQPSSVAQKGYKHDDTPRAFARLMQVQNSKKRPRSSLDDGQTGKTTKKQKTNDDAPPIDTGDVAAIEPSKVEIPKIQPGERLGDFAARVDRAFPVGGLARKGKVKVDGIKEQQTKTEKRLHKMYASWREEDARRKEREEERIEQEEEAEEERKAELGGQSVRLPASSKKGKRKKVIGEAAGSDDEDPWAQLKLRRDRPKGLHDVAQAPPNFKAIPKEKFKVRNGAGVQVANVPVAAGSLKRREELSTTRREVIERYRSMMKRAG
jgi:hypothetical protein